MLWTFFFLFFFFAMWRQLQPSPGTEYKGHFCTLQFKGCFQDFFCLFVYYKMRSAPSIQELFTEGHFCMLWVSDCINSTELQCSAKPGPGRSGMPHNQQEQEDGKVVARTACSFLGRFRYFMAHRPNPAHGQSQSIPRH